MARAPVALMQSAELDDALAEIRAESWAYSRRKPGKVPPANSPNCPTLGELWRGAFIVTTKRRNAKTFSFAGQRFGLVYWDCQLCVMNINTRRVLVRAPTSARALSDLSGVRDTL